MTQTFSPVEQHRSHGPKILDCAVITISSSRTKNNDDTGRIIQDTLRSSGHKISYYTVIRDDIYEIQKAIREASHQANIIITNGGTGVSPSDVTLEALEPLWKKRLDGFGELFRSLSYSEIGSAAMLTRATAGIIENRFVVCLPGSPNAASLAVKNLVLPELTHVAGLLNSSVTTIDPANHHDHHHHSHEHHHDASSPSEKHGMRPLGFLMPFSEAMAKLEPLVKTIDDIVDVSLLSGNRRVLAEDVYSPVNVPNQDRCAVDGYAIISHDTENALAETPTVVRMIGQVDIVSTENLVVSPGTCVKVATGSRIPNGADAVVMVEYTVADHDHIRISRKVESGRDIVRQGEDISKGDRILQHGQVLTPGRIGAAAAIGVNHLKVFRKPNVAIIPTGDEIVTPGHELPDGKIYDINTYTLAAIVTANGGTATAMNPVKDSLSSLTRLLNTSSYDLIVFTGGSSVGEKDFVVDLVRENGEIIFHGIATKPGRPTLFGQVNGTLILGLPGFPASALSMGYMILRKILRKMSRLDNEIDTTLKVQLDSSIKSVLGRTDIVPVTIQNGRAIPILKGSSSITGIATGDGYIVIPDIVEKLEKDDLVDVHLY